MLEELDESVFVESPSKLGSQEEKNLRQNIFQYMKKFKPKFKERGLTLICRMDYEDPEDKNSKRGFRIWVTKEKKK